MRQAVINGVCGGIIGYCLRPGWAAFVGLTFLAVVIINSIWGDQT